MNDDQKNPYKWECKKHGTGYGPVDECPYCMEENYRNNPPDEYHYCPVCNKPVDTEHGDDPDAVIVYFGDAGWDFHETVELIEIFHATCYAKIWKCWKKSLKRQAPEH